MDPRVEAEFKTLNETIKRMADGFRELHQNMQIIETGGKTSMQSGNENAAQISRMWQIINDLSAQVTASTSTSPPNARTITEADQIKRIMNTNLLPKFEPKEFGKDQSYETWSEGIKIDLVGYLPEAAQMIKEIEDLETLTKLKAMSEEDAYKFIREHACSSKANELVDSKMYTLLYRLVKHHPVAAPKIKPAHKDNCGLYASQQGLFARPPPSRVGGSFQNAQVRF